MAVLTEGNEAAAPTQQVRLTRRETVVLRELAKEPNATLYEIATTLFVTRNTVKSQVRSIYQKLEVSSRVEAVARARELGIIRS